MGPKETQSWNQKYVIPRTNLNISILTYYRSKSIRVYYPPVTGLSYLFMCGLPLTG